MGGVVSYIRAKLVDAESDGVGMIVNSVVGAPDIDCNLHDENLDFILALIKKVNDLGEGEALVVWKEIF